MPVYCYKCKDCSKEFEVRHSMNFEEQICIDCTSANVFKLPSLSKKKVQVANQNKPGKIVDEYIRDAKKEIKQQKIDLSSEEV